MALGLTMTKTGLAVFLLQFLPAVAVASNEAISAPVPIAQRELSSPVLAYHKAWQSVRDYYFDKTFNGQEWARWEHKYDKHLNTGEDVHYAIDTMLASLGDKYTRHVLSDEFETGCIRGILGGIGVQLAYDKLGNIEVVDPLETLPAARAGIVSGDQILAIDGVPVPHSKNLQDISRLIKGELGTTVSIKIRRQNELRDFVLPREEIVVPSISKPEMLTEQIGYLRISSVLSCRATEKVKKALNELANAKGIVLDLRNNPGGLLSAAIEISSAFVEQGTIVSTIDCKGTTTSAAADGNFIWNKPVVVLINSGTASAAEIIAGALHDNGCAEIVGQKSYGKGLVHCVNSLPDGSGLNLSIAHYVTPSNIDININGIAPDHNVEITPDDLKQGKGPWFVVNEETHRKGSLNDGKDLQLEKAKQVLGDRINSPVNHVLSGRVERQSRSFLSTVRSNVVKFVSKYFKQLQDLLGDLA